MNFKGIAHEHCWEESGIHHVGMQAEFFRNLTIKHSLEQEGAVTVGEKEGADIFVINTCSVTDIAEKKGRQMIRKIIHRNPGAYIVVVGCYAQLRAQEIMAIEGVTSYSTLKTNPSGSLSEGSRRTGTTCSTFL